MSSSTFAHQTNTFNLFTDSSLSKSEWNDALLEALDIRQKNTLYRIEPVSSDREYLRRIIIDGCEYFNFGSNDYLGLSMHPSISKALCKAAQKYGVGSGGSAAVVGRREIHTAFEQEIATFCGFPKALLFSTGYSANMAVMTSLLSNKDTVYADKLCHASIIDGCRLSGATFKRFRHQDTTHLIRLLEQHEKGKALIVTEGLFSMDGDVAPLSELLQIAKKYDALLVIDEAHSFGVMGPQGRGAIAMNDIVSPRIVMVGTLGKAAGVCGAFVAASPIIIETLTQFGRPHIYSTSLPVPIVYALQAALHVIKTEENRRSVLRSHISCLQSVFKELNQPLSHPYSPIQPCILGKSEKALQISQQLKEAGFWVPAIRPPTVPVNTSRLRISLSAAHSHKDIERFCKVLKKLRNE